MTIKDIAKACGVSVSTVSRVLNNHPDVSQSVRERVQAMVESSGYIPNNSARDLVRTQSDAIGVVVRGRDNLFFSAMVKTISREIDSLGYTMVLHFIESDDDEVMAGAILEREKKLRGLLFLGGRFDYSAETLAPIGVPFVCCTYTNAYGTLDPSKYSSVSIADEQEAYRAVMELAKKGHRRIAALTADPDDSSISQLRYSGYARALRELGIPPEEEDVICADDFTVESGCRAMRERLKRPADFTAVFAIADDMAIGAMRALRESGRSIPEDCSIIAIDGINVSEYIHPMLTTLCQPMTAMGTKSVELLLGVIRGGAHDHLTLPTTLRAGESVRDLTK